MAQFPGLVSTLSASELTSVALGHANEHHLEFMHVAKSFQCLLTLWSRLKTLAEASSDPGLTKLADDLTPMVVNFRQRFDTTHEIIEVVSNMWISAAYIHYTRNVSNLIPVLSSDEVIAALAQAQYVRSGRDGSLHSDEIEATRTFCTVYAGIYVVADQLCVRLETRERANYLMGPILRLLMESMMVNFQELP